MTQAPATGLWGPGDFGPDFVTIDELYEQQEAIPDHGTEEQDDEWHELYAQLFIRCSPRDTLLDLAHDLDARGLVMVPRSPTPLMQQQGMRSLGLSDIYNCSHHEVWDAMVAAAPIGNYTWPDPWSYVEAMAKEPGLFEAPEPAYTADADLVTGGE